MGNRFHSALVCEPPLVEALASAASAAIARRSQEPLRAFWHAHNGRLAAFDAVRVPLDAALAERAAGCWGRLARGAFANEDEVRALLGAARRVPARPRPVSRTAQRELGWAVERLAQLVELGPSVPAGLVNAEAGYARAALEALDAANLSASRLAAEGDAPSLSALMGLCCVPGLDGDVGAESVDGLPPENVAFVAGSPLFVTPFVGEGDAPAPELFERTLARFGAYSASWANELLGEDAAEIVGSWYSAPCWGCGEALAEAAAAVDEAIALALGPARHDQEANALAPGPARHDQEASALAPDEARDGRGARALATRLRAFRDVVADAAERHYAVIEWVTKY